MRRAIDCPPTKSLMSRSGQAGLGKRVWATISPHKDTLFEGFSFWFFIWKFSKSLGSFSVHESFKDYITPERLEGDNKYDAGDFGMQVCLL